MGKRQHQKDKLYLTTTEWSQLYGGRRATADLERDLLTHFKRLPFGHCCLSLQPLRDPYCNQDGYVFDLVALLPFVQKHKVDPVSGKPTDMKQYTKLNFSRDSDNKIQCPILFKVFNENSHVIAIKTTGNVYSYEAIEQLNLKNKNFRDLLTDKEFTRQDMITLQAPDNLDKQNVSRYYYQVHGLKWEDEDEKLTAGSTSNLKNVNHTLKAVLNEMENSESTLSKGDFFYKDPSKVQSSSSTSAPLDRFNSATYSTGKVAASLTSTCMPITQKLEVAYIGDDAYKYQNVKKKGYVQLQTNFGPLNLELFCKDAPKTCDNFMLLCERGYYDNTTFHRLIKHFVLQGGDPTGTGRGGESVWGGMFNDEFDNNLTHNQRGILSMANAGKNSNKSQFFITLKSCAHLDKKHTIFGKLVGGMETLDKIEKIKTTDKDRPIQDVIIVKTNVFVNPFKEIEKQIQDEREGKNQAVKDEKPKEKATPHNLETNIIKKGIGALIDLKSAFKSQPDNNELCEKPAKKKKTASSQFGDFSSW